MNLSNMTTGQLKYAWKNWDKKNPIRKHAIAELERRTIGMNYRMIAEIKEEVV